MESSAGKRGLPGHIGFILTFDWFRGWPRISLSFLYAVEQTQCNPRLLLHYFDICPQEQEKEDLLGQYRVLSGETERLVSESKASAGQVNNYHMELIQKERSEMELSDKIRRLESEIQQVGGDNLFYACVSLSGSHKINVERLAPY